VAEVEGEDEGAGGDGEARGDTAHAPPAEERSGEQQRDEELIEEQRKIGREVGHRPKR
jgi:hypothetical protein